MRTSQGLAYSTGWRGQPARAIRETFVNPLAQHRLRRWRPVWEGLKLFEPTSGFETGELLMRRHTLTELAPILCVENCPQWTGRNARERVGISPGRSPARQQIEDEAV